MLVIFEMCASKNGVAACEIERKYGLCSRGMVPHAPIREAMKDDGLIATIAESSSQTKPSSAEPQP